ncbi:MAG: CvpA family protein, partial [Solirubrobacteraceae bacterium]
MTGIDWVILGAVALLALFGWAQGFIAGALALAGFAAGAWLATRLAPMVLPEGDESQWAPAFALAGAIVAGAVLAASFEGAGTRLRRLV